jgi:uncharacterized damage-inducible protein DinB
MQNEEFARFLQVWDDEAALTVRVIAAIPADKYDFRPDPGGRSLGEMAWHLCEGDAYNSLGVAEGGFSPDMRPPGMERPKQVAALAPGFERVHREAVARIKGLDPKSLDREIPFYDGKPHAISWILWGTIQHLVHHRAQLMLMIRLAGGVAPGIYGPNREEMAAMQGPK